MKYFSLVIVTINNRRVLEQHDFVASCLTNLRCKNSNILAHFVWSISVTALIKTGLSQGFFILSCSEDFEPLKHFHLKSRFFINSFIYLEMLCLNFSSLKHSFFRLLHFYFNYLHNEAI